MQTVIDGMLKAWAFCLYIQIMLAGWVIALRRLLPYILQFCEYGARHDNSAHVQGVPTNELHACGYVSIGCEPCTRAVLPNQHEREGRWWWEVCYHLNTCHDVMLHDRAIPVILHTQ